MPAPERRTRRDVLAATVLVLVALIVGTALWWTSDVRHTVLTTARDGEEQLPTPGLPTALQEVWRVASPATVAPLVRRGTVVTGSGVTGSGVPGPRAGGGEVAGRDPRTGEVRWSYQRDLPLCTVADAFNHVLAVYQRGASCSEVTSLAWEDGRRGAQRNGPVEAPTQLVGDSAQVATTGQRYLEVWRTDLVRTLAYGRLPTPVQPQAQPRPDCTHGSVALSAGRIALIERCPDERAARLTVQRSQPQEPNQPEVEFSVLLPGEHARIVTVGTDQIAVAVPDPARLLLFNTAGQRVAEYPLAVPDADLRDDDTGVVAMTTTTPVGLSWFTGSVTVALDAGTLRPRWTWPAAAGSGTMIAGRLVLPIRDALVVLDVMTGQKIAELAVDRGGYSGPVAVAASGDMVLEQRGDTLVALRAAM